MRKISASIVICILLCAAAFGALACTNNPSGPVLPVEKTGTDKTISIDLNSGNVSREVTVADYVELNGAEDITYSTKSDSAAKVTVSQPENGKFTVTAVSVTEGTKVTLSLVRGEEKILSVQYNVIVTDSAQAAAVPQKIKDGGDVQLLLLQNSNVRTFKISDYVSLGGALNVTYEVESKDGDIVEVTLNGTSTFTIEALEEADNVGVVLIVKQSGEEVFRVSFAVSASLPEVNEYTGTGEVISNAGWYDDGTGNYTVSNEGSGVFKIDYNKTTAEYQHVTAFISGNTAVKRVAVTLKGATGGETVMLHIADGVEKSFTLSASAQEFSLSAPAGSVGSVIYLIAAPGALGEGSFTVSALKLYDTAGNYYLDFNTQGNNAADYNNVTAKTDKGFTLDFARSATGWEYGIYLSRVFSAASNYSHLTLIYKLNAGAADFKVETNNGFGWEHGWAGDWDAGNGYRARSLYIDASKLSGAFELKIYVNASALTGSIEFKELYFATAELGKYPVKTNDGSSVNLLLVQSPAQTYDINSYVETNSVAGVTYEVESADPTNVNVALNGSSTDSTAFTITGLTVSAGNKVYLIVKQDGAEKFRITFTVNVERYATEKSGTNKNITLNTNSSAENHTSTVSVANYINLNGATPSYQVAITGGAPEVSITQVSSGSFTITGESETSSAVSVTLTVTQSGRPDIVITFTVTVIATSSPTEVTDSDKNIILQNTGTTPDITLDISDYVTLNGASGVTYEVSEEDGTKVTIALDAGASDSVEFTITGIASCQNVQVTLTVKQDGEVVFSVVINVSVLYYNVYSGAGEVSSNRGWYTANDEIYTITDEGAGVFTIGYDKEGTGYEGITAYVSGNANVKRVAVTLQGAAGGEVVLFKIGSAELTCTLTISPQEFTLNLFGGNSGDTVILMAAPGAAGTGSFTVSALKFYDAVSNYYLTGFNAYGSAQPLSVSNRTDTGFTASYTGNVDWGCFLAIKVSELPGYVAGISNYSGITFKAITANTGIRIKVEGAGFTGYEETMTDTETTHNIAFDNKALVDEIKIFINLWSAADSSLNFTEIYLRA